MQTTGTTIKAFVEHIVSNIIDHPDKLNLSVLESDSMVVIEMTCAPEDVGKVIGREGRMALALRVLVNALATKLGKKAILQILERN